MKTSDFSFELPAELIAQTPLAERSASRLLAVDGRTADVNHLSFRDLPSLLNSDDLLVFNNTRVLPARLYAQKQTGGRVEILIERMLGDGGAVAHVRASKSPKEGALLLIAPDAESDVSDLTLRVTGRQGALFLLEPESGTLKEMMRRFGHMPLRPTSIGTTRPRTAIVIKRFTDIAMARSRHPPLDCILIRQCWIN